MGEAAPLREHRARDLAVGFIQKAKAMGRTVYLVGSVPLKDAREVFETVGPALGPRLRWLPDGETGERLDWITWLESVFASSEALQPSGKVFRVHADAPPRIRYQLRPGRSVQDIVFDNLFYADLAIRSYADFARAKAAGKIDQRCKFQVDLVPAHSVLWLYIEDEIQSAVDPIYNDAVMREIDKIAAAIPHSELAIQFDVASAVFARLQRGEASSYGATKDQTRENFARIVADLANHVSPGIDLLFHFCYGDSNHKHVVEPRDMGDMVDMANVLTQKIKRPIQLIHMPVPRDRSDDSYFEPLRGLQIAPDTELCLGLVHYTDGIEGTRQRVATALKYMPNFAIGTECGFGRRSPETIPQLLHIHTVVADAPA